MAHGPWSVWLGEQLTNIIALSNNKGQNKKTSIFLYFLSHQNDPQKQGAAKKIKKTTIDRSTSSKRKTERWWQLVFFGIQRKSGAWLTWGGVGGLWNLLSPSHPLSPSLTLPHDLPRSVHSILRLFNLHPPSLPLFISHLSLPRSHHITKQTTQFVKFGPSHSSASIMSTSGDGVSTPKASIDRPTTITSMHTLTPSESIKRSLPPVLIDKADVDPPYLDVRRFNPLWHDLHWIQEVFVTHSMFSFTSI